jgi:hypothetical protein
MAAERLIQKGCEVRRPDSALVRCGVDALNFQIAGRRTERGIGIDFQIANASCLLDLPITTDQLRAIGQALVELADHLEQRERRQ